MMRKQIEQYRLDLVQIQAQQDVNKKWEEARDLALKVGASIWRIYPLKDSDIQAPTHALAISEAREAATAEIVHNIHQALQTATMIDMCSTANRNWIIATVASASAFLSMLATWAAV